MESLYPSSRTEQKHIPNFYRIKRFRDKYLLTTENGGWVLLSGRELDRFVRSELLDEESVFLEKKGIIITPKNIEQVLDAASKRYLFLRSGVALHIMIPTLRCNHRCVYCHSSAESDIDTGCDMTQETADRILDFIFQCPSKSIKIEFQGGEPLLQFGLFKHIVEESRKKSDETGKELKFALVTNLTIIDEEKLAWISEHDVKITTSLDGPKELHDSNRTYLKGQGTYDHVAAKIRFLQDKGQHAGLLMVTTRKSLSFWKEIIDEYARWKSRTIQLKYMSRLGYADPEWKNIGYDAEEFIIFWRKSMDYLLELNKKGMTMMETFTVLILMKLISGKDPGFLDFRTPCGIANGQLAYNHNGDIYSCDEGRNFELFKLGNVRDNTYKEVIGSQEAQRLAEASILDNYFCDSCAYKPYCGTCPVLNYAENGNIIPDVVKNNKCRITKAQIDWTIEKLLFDEKAQQILNKWRFT